MASFGRYQSVRELHRSGFTVVYSGRTAAGTAEEFAIKVLQPSALLLEREQTKTESQLFLNSARTQQKVAARGAQHWAPIYQCGSTPDGAFYATDKYDRSLQQLINGRVKLAANNLHTIIEAVAKGLIELKQVYDRPHGNLKATNVLISDSKIVLSDPLPDQYIDDQVHWDADLRLIAEMIYQLVMHRPSPEVSAWQVPDSKEWATLGRQANDWRNLCNRLLNAHLKPGTMTIEALIEELAQLKKTKPVLSSRWLVAAGLIVVACAVILPILWRFIRPALPVEIPPRLKTGWPKLCNDYVDWVEYLKIKGNKRADQWRKDTDLKEILVKIDVASYPDEVKPVGKDVRDMKDDLELVVDVNEPKKAREAIAAIDGAIKAIEDIKSFFNPNPVRDPNSYKAWPLLVNVYDAAKGFEEREWQKPAAAYLDYLVKSVKPPSKKIAEHVDQILDVNKNHNIDEISSIQEDIDGYKDKWPQACGELLGDVQKFVNEVPSKKVFQEWFQTAGGYHKLGENPRGERKEWDKRALDSAEDIQLIRQYDTNSAEKLSEKLKAFNKDVNDVFDIPGIEKNKAQIQAQVRLLEQKFVKLVHGDDGINVTLAKYVKDPIDWFENKEKEDYHITTFEPINSEWRRRRDIELAKHRHLLPDWKQKLKLSIFVDLEEKLDTTKRRLQHLEKELLWEADVALETKTWNNEIRNIYNAEIEQTFSEIVRSMSQLDEFPDVNSPGFEKWRSRLGINKNRRKQLYQLITAFNEIEARLGACYLLDDGLPQEGETIRSLWNEWKDANILKEPGISDALAKLTARVEKLIEVEQSGDKQELVKIADTAVQTEAAYAAWVRLGELSDPRSRWPSEAKEWEKDKEIQDRLKAEFETIKRQNQTRGDLLLKILVDTGLEHEIVFRRANIGRDKTTITKNSSQDKILVAFEALRPTGDNLNDINDLETLARDLAVFVTDPNWPTKFRPDIFADESPLYEKATLTKSDFENWLQDVKDYRKLDNDPRMSMNYTWDKKIDKIKSAISNELDREPTGEYLAKLESLVLDFNKIEPKIKKMLSLDAIEKHKEEIYKSKDYWNNLLNIENRLKPRVCERLELLKDGQLVFGAKFLDPNLFEPVDAINKKPVRLLTGWQEVREGINKKQKEWLDFFYTIDVNDTKNVGWPEYVRSTTDESVILKFIPADPPANLEPFYMAIQEITNAQYQMFLEKTGATSFAGNEDAWSWFKSTGRDLILCTSSDNPSCAIKWDGASFKVTRGSDDVPVTYVTYYGAQSYAENWLGAQLPRASQHKYACKAGTNNIYPWGNRDDLAQIPYYAHVRGEPWRGGRDEYNSKIGTLDIPPLPVGAVKPKDFEPYQSPLSDANTVHEEATYGAGSSWLPIKHTNSPNAWGLYDLIGNVWEWCIDDEDNTQSVICGGSCLAPPKYILLGSESDYTISFNEQASDVGFRVIVPAR